MITAHDANFALVHSSQLQLSHRSVFPWVVVNPDPASRLRDVSAATFALVHSSQLQLCKSCIIQPFLLRD
jgi:hypothetical protein